ncbi:MAG: MBOAT family protein, partial [Clostridia bacterium]|nr:MBOAT family protein [Clostridia bacterium]
MLFSSVTFLYAFLPLVLVLYFAAPKKLKNAVLLVSSLFFYYFGERTYISIMLISSITDWIWSLLIEHYRAKGNEKITKWFLIGSLVVNLGLLGFFKYADFFITNINALFGTAIPLTNVHLPIG